MPATPSDAMLHRVMAETQRALNTLDPAGRADIIARFVQPYSGWALRWAIEDCRAHGMAWTTIAGTWTGRTPQCSARCAPAGPVPRTSPHTRSPPGTLTPRRRCGAQPPSLRSGWRRW